VLAAVLAGTRAAAGRAAGGSNPVPRRGPTVRYLVQSGDTLWELARARLGPQGDPRPLVAEIREVNRLGAGPLEAGRILVLPG
jgi:nucleoid-associated protein YgaU